MSSEPFGVGFLMLVYSMGLCIFEMWICFSSGNFVNYWKCLAEVWVLLVVVSPLYTTPPVRNHVNHPYQQDGCDLVLSDGEPYKQCSSSLQTLYPHP